ncbi:uncharacterized protein BDZ99DRAFT_462311 [Mytilinidion resinicola]|uniref:Store-operated calcium entry-associated regulatory factor n=1 Tax=Mytilinidion resinicola TaxID=574789 RepID=A0A6A6YQ61_9PEZI|nr:uncharacterized protein BDZ99DRAFT_462311 [Mytilinidion resinicola]KAF2811036.1 hypothetical protein BDZ99DRAFT_462311 [Mytilinidion resinicola]
MRPHTILSSAVVAALTIAGTVEGARRPANSVLLSNVQILTLRQGKETSHRRVSAIPQLECVGGNAKGLYEVDVMRCKNAGSDYDDDNVQWTCTASLPEDFKLGSTDVVCEGYESPDDPYILKGSCGVEYRLILTEKGEEKYGKKKPGWFSEPTKGKPQEDNHTQDNHTLDNAGARFVAALFWLIFCAVVIYMIYSAFFARGGGTRQPETHTPNYGGGGGGGDDDPPPPYDYRPSPKPQHRTYTRPRTYTQPQPAPQPGNAWRPGFWTGTGTGAAAGAAAGYAAGRATRTEPAPPTRSAPSPPAPRGGGGGGGWFGGGESSSTRSSSARSGSSGSSGPAPSTTRHESTGFGSSRRR